MRPTVIQLGFSLLLTAIIAWLPASATDAHDLPEGLPRLDQALAGKTISVHFEQPTRVRDIYRSVAEHTGIEVTFDRQLQDFELALAFENLDLRAALDRISHAAGHFWRAIDPTGIVVADDTPQNRRAHELQVVRTFDVEHVRPKDMVTILRSVIGFKNIATDKDSKTITMRDTAAKVAIADRIIQRLDRPRQQITLDIVLMRVQRDAFSDLRDQAGDGMLRLSADQRLRLRTEGSVIAEPTLSIVDGESARHKLLEPITGEDGEATYLDLSLDFAARSQAESSSVTLGVRVGARLVGPDGPVSSRDSDSTVAIGSEDSIAFFDWMPLPGDEMSVLVVRPKLHDRPAIAARNATGFVVGTESSIQMPASP